MLIRDYKLPTPYEGLVKVGASAQTLVEPTQWDEQLKQPDVIVWRGALTEEGVVAGMRQPDWAMRILQVLTADSGFKWQAMRPHAGDITTDWNEIIQLVSEAAGLETQPQGNVMVTLQVRNFEQDVSAAGGASWWEDLEKASGQRDEFVGALLGRMATALRELHQHGLSVYVEQITLVISKDPTEPFVSYRPSVHLDTFYGPREVMVCSLAEESCNRFFGTLFAPTVTMNHFEKHRPVFIEKMFELLDQEPVLEAQSGDFVMFDGMMDEEAKRSPENGTPHISPDTPGYSSRLLFIMRNLRLNQPGVE
jgi:hypothetical protein